ncbi:hypothetical protein LUX01_12690 [Streptomyces sudanensis]|uniref:hypothetical protein n=1 Tax=Streptomyces sudanensis TaxID=436397 RepID=UPI0020CE6B15|nr:hypothetical protein [Streptomyces sudanensis]MCP9987426.1 hypothetical protein [Streptomyces sudanensis]
MKEKRVPVAGGVHAGAELLARGGVRERDVQVGVAVRQRPPQGHLAAGRVEVHRVGDVDLLDAQLGLPGRLARLRHLGDRQGAVRRGRDPEQPLAVGGPAAAHQYAAVARRR